MRSPKAARSRLRLSLPTRSPFASVVLCGSWLVAAMGEGAKIGDEEIDKAIEDYVARVMFEIITRALGRKFKGASSPLKSILRASRCQRFRVRRPAVRCRDEARQSMVPSRPLLRG